MQNADYILDEKVLGAEPIEAYWKQSADEPVEVLVHEDGHTNALYSTVPNQLEVLRRASRNTRQADKRYLSDPEAGWRLIWRPLPLTAVYWALAALCVASAALYPGLSDRAHLLVEGWVVSMLLLLAGVFFASMAGPMSKPNDWRPEDDIQQMQDEAYFAGKHWQQR
jgi:hypothetical protein